MRYQKCPHRHLRPRPCRPRHHLPVRRLLFLLQLLKYRFEFGVQEVNRFLSHHLKRFPNALIGRSDWWTNERSAFKERVENPPETAPPSPLGDWPVSA